VKGQTNSTIIAKKLQRKQRNSMTDAEQALWQVLRGRQMMEHKFRRQHPFGDYILDFVCLENQLVIEIDGSQHAEQVEADFKRSKKLEQAGFFAFLE
jgi:very-short-patch-repair endonuclease